jgi:hypothetical protein
MATIGALAAKLTLNAGAFSASVGGAITNIRKLSTEAAGAGKAMSTAFTGAAKSLAGLAVGATASIAALASKGANLSGSLFEAARSLGATTSGLATLRVGARLLGGDASDADAALSALNDTLAAASRGSATATATLSSLGLSVQKITSLSVDKAFVAIANAMNQIKDPAQRAAIATRLFGDAAGKILPLLSSGSMEDFAKAARQYGHAIDDAAASAAADAASFTEFKLALEGVAMQIATQLAPLINTLNSYLVNLASRGSGVGDIISGAMQYAARGVAFLVDWFVNLRIAVNLVYTGIVSLVRGATWLIEKFVALLGHLPDRLGGDMFRATAKSLEKMGTALRGEIDATAKALDRDFYSDSARGSVLKFFDDLAKAQEKAAKSRLSLKLAGGATNIFARDRSTFSRAASVIEAAKTPLQSFNETLIMLNKTLSVDSPESWRVFARAAGKALEQLESAYNLSDIKLAGAVMAGTTDAYSAVVRSTRETDMRLRESPQARVARILEQSKEIERRQEKYLEEIARALAIPAKEVVIP